MDSKLFWELVKSKHSELETAAINGKLAADTYTIGTVVEPLTRQPKQTCQSIWISSLDHWDRNTQAGTTLLALPRIAAQRIVENTHRLATAEEIAAEKERQTATKERNDRTEGLLNRRTQIAIKVPQN